VITLSDLRTELDKNAPVKGRPGDRVILVDPRAPEDFARGHLPGAINRQLADVRIGVEPDPEIERFGMAVVYADNPASSTARAMAKRMITNGYRGVRYFAGGLAEWRAAGLPVSSALDAPADPARK
jgi:rhodanese-related sulfurtransferase